MWQRKFVKKLDFEVHVFVEGYRPFKDVFVHTIENFDAFEEAKAFVEKIEQAPWQEQENSKTVKN